MNGKAALPYQYITVRPEPVEGETFGRAKRFLDFFRNLTKIPLTTQKRFFKMHLLFVTMFYI